MKPLKEPTEAELKESEREIAHFFGLDYDPNKDYTHGDIVIRAVRGLQTYVQALLAHLPHRHPQDKDRPVDHSTADE